MTERLSDADRLAAVLADAPDPGGWRMGMDADDYRVLAQHVLANFAQQAPTTDEPAAPIPYLWVWRISHLTWSGTTDVETAAVMAREYGQAPQPLYRRPAPATDDPTARVLAVLNDWETTEPEDGWGGLADDIRAALTQTG